MIPRKRRGGFSLVETVVALAIIAISIIQIVTVIVHTMRMQQNERETVIAKNAAQQKIEEIRRYGYTVPGTTNFGASIWTTYNNQAFAVEGLTAAPGYTQPGLVTIDSASGTAPTNPNLVDITVTIRWSSNPPSKYYLRTLVTR